MHQSHNARAVRSISSLEGAELWATCTGSTSRPAARAIGIEASHRPLNDIVVGGRKIGGTGIAAIGQAMVVAGSVMFSFDTQTMARALKVSSEKMRDKVLSGDFTFYPAPLLGRLETALRGHRLDGAELTSVVREFYSSSGVQSPGVEPADFARALLKLDGGAGSSP